jgi:hypothetical protein
MKIFTELDRHLNARMLIFDVGSWEKLLHTLNIDGGWVFNHQFSRGETEK